MVCDQTDRYVHIFIFFIFCVSQLTDFVSEGTDCVNIKNGIHILHSYSQTLQAHACVDVLLLQFFIVAFPVIFKLGKYIIPHFHVAVTFTAHSTARFSASIALTSVIVDLRAWSAWACAVLPEVVLFPKTENTVSRNSNLFIPDIKCLIIVKIDRRIQTVRVKSYHLGQKFP